jgi:hypothetical protein
MTWSAPYPSNAQSRARRRRCQWTRFSPQTRTRRTADRSTRMGDRGVSRMSRSCKHESGHNGLDGGAAAGGVIQERVVAEARDRIGQPVVSVTAIASIFRLASTVASASATMRWCTTSSSSPKAETRHRPSQSPCCPSKARSTSSALCPYLPTGAGDPDRGVAIPSHGTPLDVFLRSTQSCAREARGTKALVLRGQLVPWCRCVYTHRGAPATWSRGAELVALSRACPLRRRLASARVRTTYLLGAAD